MTSSPQSHEALIAELEGWCTDWDDKPMKDAEEPRSIPTCGELRRLAEALRSTSVDNARMVEALNAIYEGKVPRPIVKAWRRDGAYSKLDQCAHGLAMNEDCGGCIENFAFDTLRSIQPVDHIGGVFVEPDSPSQ